MIMFPIFCIIFGYYSQLWVTVGTEELAIDPMSIFVDQNLYLFCWKPIGKPEFKDVKVLLQPSNQTFVLQIIQDDAFDKETYCIKILNYQNTYIVPLPITKETTSPKYFYFYVRFKNPMVFQMEIIQHKIVSNGVHLQFNSDFAGLNNDISPMCQIIFVSQLKKRKTFQSFNLKESVNKMYCPTGDDTSFTFYYTCDFTKILTYSTKVIKRSGVLDYYSDTKDLRILIQMPLRRFIQAAWKPNNPANRYDVAIYKRTSNGTFKCLKIFRIFLKKSPKTRHHMPSNCIGNIPVEDLGYFNGNGDGSIHVILDMVNILAMYKDYKFAIFWKENYEEVKNNFVIFTPWPNQHNGKINDKFNKIIWNNYDDLKKETSPIYQSVPVINLENPYKRKDIQMTPYRDFEILSSVIRSTVPTNAINEFNKHNSIYKWCKRTNCLNDFFPYFYTILKLKDEDTILTEILQIPTKIDEGNKIDGLEIKPNYENLCLDMSWKISNHPYVTTPAMFGIQILTDNNDECHNAYFLYCRTCNEIYKTQTKSGGNRTIKVIKEKCKDVIHKYDHYDAIDSRLSFSTEGVLENGLYKINFFVFINEIMDDNYIIEPIRFEASFYQKHRSAVVGIISSVSVALVLVGLYFCCKYVSRDPVVNKTEKEESNDDNLYDEENI